MIHLTPRWPFVEGARTRRAREQYEKAVEQRPEVDRAVAELVQRGRRNHFAEALEELIGGKRR